MVDGETIGASITAAASLDNFNNTYYEPGVFFAASDDVAKLAGYIQLLDAYRGSFESDCKFKGRNDYKDSAYEGAYDVYDGLRRRDRTRWWCCRPARSSTRPPCW